MLDRSIFFAEIKKSLFGGSFKQSQVDGTTTKLDVWETQYCNNDLRYLAYALATSYHETARTMQPIEEYGKGKGRKYGVKGKYGQVPYGRGDVQLTWDYNYEKADKELNLNGALLKDFNLALRPDISASIMYRGMIEGWFTGRKLSQYFGKTSDWKGARKIINGTDKAELIATYAQKFYAAIKASIK